jgi:hypothetical protein
VYHHSFSKPQGMSGSATDYEMESEYVQATVGRAFERKLLRTHTLDKAHNHTSFSGAATVFCQAGDASNAMPNNDETDLPEDTPVDNMLFGFGPMDRRYLAVAWYLYQLEHMVLDAIKHRAPPDSPSHIAFQTVQMNRVLVYRGNATSATAHVDALLEDWQPILHDCFRYVAPCCYPSLITADACDNTRILL